MKVTRWLHTRFRVNDLERSLLFYTGVLGLKEISRSSSPRGSTLVFPQPSSGGEVLELCHFPSSGPVEVPPDLIHIAFEVDDLDTFGKQASNLGFPWSDGPTVTENGVRFAFLDAPEGYEVEIIERMEKSGKITP